MTDPTTATRLSIGNCDLAATAFRWAIHGNGEMMRTYVERMSPEVAREIAISAEDLAEALRERGQVHL